MGKINYECEHATGNGLCKICEFNDKPCPFENDIMECEIVRDEHGAEESEIKQNDYD